MGTRSIVDLLEAYPSEEERELPSYKIYCDLDGVLTDFDNRFIHFTGEIPKVYEEKYGTAAFWYLIDTEVGIKFWSEMDWMPQGKRFWESIKKYSPCILTSPSRQNTSRLGKKLWVKENLKPLPKVLFAFSREKHQYADSNSILIDDRKRNIKEWEQAGGIGILYDHRKIEEALEGLKKLGY